MNALNLHGFRNALASEAVVGALPEHQNAPLQVMPWMRDAKNRDLGYPAALGGHPVAHGFEESR